MAKSKSSKTKSGKKTLAEKADKFTCYQKSVQTPEHEVEFFEQAYREANGRKKPMTLREDFCGTFAVCCEWVKSNRKRTSLGVDLCGDTLQWGREHNLIKLNDSQKSRLKLLQQDVRKRNRRAAMAAIAKFYRGYPNLFAGVTVDGELEHNWLNGDLITDYNPFAILEFRDWILGKGLYDVGSELAGHAYANATRYGDDVAGLQNFNADFGTEFTTWNLKHYGDADFAEADDNFECTFPPPDEWECPSYSWEVLESGPHQVVVENRGDCRGTEAGYAIIVDSPTDPGLELAHDDFTYDEFWEEVTMGHLNDSQGGLTME